MRSLPQVSIILPTFHRPVDLHATLSQIRANVGVPYEVLILDNSAHPTRLELNDGETYLFIGNNEGAAARNRGIRLARAPYLLMLDDDSHPLPGALETALPILRNSPPSVAGLLGNVTRLNGSPESTLLPTALLGCGVLFKSSVLRHLPRVYPGGFCFYGEEYVVTMKLYRAGFSLDACEDLRIVHRASTIGRDRKKIFYHLGRNNAAVWRMFTPPAFLDQVLEDTRCRYEFIADREGVRPAFDQGLAEALPPDLSATPLSHDRFRAFSLLHQFEAAAGQCRSSRGVVLCGTGKFPGLWARALQAQGIKHVVLADFNPALIGQSFSNWNVLAPGPAVALGKLGYTFLLGHASATDTLRWQQLLANQQVRSDSVIAMTATTTNPRDETADQAA